MTMAQRPDLHEGFDALVLIIMSGLQASGKSTTARTISRNSGAVLIANHEIRSRLTDWVDKYSPESTRHVYNTALSLAEEELYRNRSVILDAMYLTRHWREKAYGIAEKHGALPIVVNCVCPDLEIVKRRTRGRKDVSSPQAEGDEMKYYERTKAIAESLEGDFLSFPLAPLIITYNTANTTIETLHGSVPEIKTIVKLLKESQHS